MAGVERVTVTLPNDLVRDIDRREKNRSKFVAEAVRHELDRRRRKELGRSLQNPHPESAELAGLVPVTGTPVSAPGSRPERPRQEVLRADRRS
jgi:Arc/MetJ-type ribon-helix-helix transcriptional regulator